MYDMRDRVAPNCGKDSRFVPQIHFFKYVLGMPLDSGDILEMASVSEAVEVDQFFDLWRVDDVLNQIASNEACTA